MMKKFIDFCTRVLITLLAILLSVGIFAGALAIAVYVSRAIHDCPR
jgi:hypothetical protein